MRNKVTVKMATWLGPRLAEIARSRRPDFEIGEEETYLARWWIIPRNPIFNIYLHVFFRDDTDEALHDHPFASLSLLCGRVAAPKAFYQDEDSALWEVYLDKTGNELIRRLACGSLVYRGPRFTHRMIVPNPGAMTLFVTGPRVREWGFLTKNGWVRSSEFVEGSRA